MDKSVIEKWNRLTTGEQQLFFDRASYLINNSYISGVEEEELAIRIFASELEDETE